MSKIELSNRSGARDQTIVLIGVAPILTVIAILFGWGELERFNKGNADSASLGFFVFLSFLALIAYVFIYFQIKKIVWRVDLDESEIAVHRTFDKKVYQWSSVKKLSLPYHYKDVPLIFLPVPLPVNISSSHYIVIYFDDGYSFHSHAADDKIDRISELLISLESKDTDHFANYRRALSSLSLPNIASAFWVHYGDIPERGINKERLIDAIIEKVREDRALDINDPM